MMSAAQQSDPPIDLRATGDLSRSATFMLTLLVITLAIVVRLVWIGWADAVPGFTIDGQVQPTTQDALYHGATIDGLLDDRLDHVPMVPSVPGTSGVLPLIGAGGSIIMGSTPAALLWMPVLLSGLLAIPVIGIGRALGRTGVGVGGAVLSVIAVNYFERTIAGYYDHDMLSITLAACIPWLLLTAGRHRSHGWLLAAALTIFLYPFVYAHGTPVAVGLAGMWILLQLIMHPRDDWTWRSLPVIAVAAATCPLMHGGWLPSRFGLAIAALVVVLLLWTLLRRWTPTRGWIIAGCCAAATLVVVLFPWNDSWRIVQAYVQTAELGGSDGGPYEAISYHRPHRVSIFESQLLGIQVLCIRLLGSVVAAGLGVIGYLWACRRRPMLLTLLPMAALGVFALVGGVRFIIWGTVPAALGASWLVLAAAAFVGTTLWPRRPAMKTVLGVLALFALALPNLLHAVGHRPPTVVIDNEVEALHSIEKRTMPTELVLSWWDYGTSIWYYANRRVLVHPGYVSNDLYPLSRMFTGTSQPGSARLALALATARARGSIPALTAALQSTDGEPVRGVEQIEQGVVSSSGEHTAVLYIPLKMMGTLEAISTFAEPDRIAGTVGTPLYARMMPAQYDRPDGVVVSPFNQLAVDESTNTVGLLNEAGGIDPVGFASVTKVTISADGSTKLDPIAATATDRWFQINDDGVLNVVGSRPSARRVHLIMLPQSGTMFAVNDRALMSTAVQMGVLGVYDPAWFEPIFIGPVARAYRVRSKP
jgi:undecaprenyl-diphosphooligosaccharide--protein glycosyltransferase